MMIQLGGTAEQIREEVLKAIRNFAEQYLRRSFEAWYHEVLNVQIRQNVRAFSNERLAELAGYVNEEVGRRAGPNLPA